MGSNQNYQKAFNLLKAAAGNSDNRYDFSESLLIHAQRPEATACAELEVWNNRMGRWVNRDSKGIALIDDSGPRRRLRCVFNISDTHMVRGGKTPYIRQMDPRIHAEMADYLMNTYGIEYDPDASLSSVLLARRCGLDPWDELAPDDFYGITGFNRLSVLSFLGNAAHDIVEPVLKDIGREAIIHYRIIAAQKEIDRYIERAGYTQEEIEKAQKELADKDGSGCNRFNTLIRKSADRDQDTEKDLEKENKTVIKKEG